MSTASAQRQPARRASDAGQLVDSAETVIRPVKSRIHFRDITGNRELIRVLVSRDLKVKYKQSLLGSVWLVFQPAAMLVGFIVGFSTVAHVAVEGVPYAVFALTGLSVWSFFAAAFTAGSLAMIGNTNLVRFTACSRLALAVANLLASSPTLIVTALAAIVSCLVTGFGSLTYLLLPLGVAWLILLTAAVVAIVASVAVRYRDIPAALPFVIQAGVFLTPVAYPADRLSGALRVVLSFNPLTGLLSVWRWILLGIPMQTASVVLSAVITIGLCGAAWFIFGRREVTMSDDI